MERHLATRFFLKRQRRKRRRLLQNLLISVLIIGFLLFLYSTFMKVSSGGQSNLVDPFISANSQTINNQSSPVVKNPLGDEIEAALSETKGTYSVVVKNLKTGESYTKDEERVYETGSLYKLWVMATVFKKIQDGTLMKDEMLEDTIPELNRKFGISSEDAELTTGGIDMTVEEAIKQMITISHNYAAYLLSDKVKVSSVADFLKTNGFEFSSIGNSNEAPKSTASDIALFWEKLYKGELADPVSTTEMLDILKAQTFDGGLPKYLPEGVVLGNKTGDIGRFKHDSGIVFLEKGDYIIVVMSESDSPLGAQDRIALVSKEVYEYFNK